MAMREGAAETVLMEGELTHKINTENSLWSLEPGQCVLVRLPHLRCTPGGLPLFTRDPHHTRCEICALFYTTETVEC